jgi:hypothetical protein
MYPYLKQGSHYTSLKMKFLEQQKSEIELPGSSPYPIEQWGLPIILTIDWSSRFHNHPNPGCNKLVDGITSRKSGNRKQATQPGKRSRWLIYYGHGLGIFAFGMNKENLSKKNCYQSENRQ